MHETAAKSGAHKAAHACDAVHYASFLTALHFIHLLHKKRLHEITSHSLRKKIV